MSTLMGGVIPFDGFPFFPMAVAFGFCFFGATFEGCSGAVVADVPELVCTRGGGTTEAKIEGVARGGEVAGVNVAVLTMASIETMLALTGDITGGVEAAGLELVVDEAALSSSWWREPESRRDGFRVRLM